jgi:hypothetical protein
MRKWFARLFAVIALGGAAAGIYFAIDSVRADDAEVTAAEARDVLEQISAANADLSARLKALRPGGSPQLARDSVHSAAALARQLDEDTGSDGELADDVHTVLVRELAFLDAVGSTLANPRSPLRGEVADKAAAVRRAFTTVPDGASSSISGLGRLIAFSEARLD